MGRIKRHGTGICRRTGTVLAQVFLMLSAVLVLSGCGKMEDYLETELRALLSAGNTVEDETAPETSAQVSEKETETEGNKDVTKSDAPGVVQGDGQELSREDIWPTGMAPYTEQDGVFRALPANVEVSSTQEPYLAGYHVVDQDVTSSWISADGDSAGAWIYVEFPTPFTISEVLVEQGDPQDFYGQGRAECIEMVFDDGTSTELFCKYEDMDIWSQEIVPKTTKSVHLNITSVYSGSRRDNVVINEITFLYNENSYFADTQGADPPVMTREIALGRRPTSLKAQDFVPGAWEWGGTGYDAQDIDNELFQAGKWVSGDGKTVLYVDFASSPDYMDYSLCHGGMIVENGAEMIWQEAENAGYYEAREACDELNDLYMEVIEKGKIRMLFEGKEMILMLNRAKY